MGSLVEHALARRAIGSARRVVGGPASLDAISSQSLARCREKKDDASSSSLSLVTGRHRPLRRRRPSAAGLNHHKAIGLGLVQCSAALGSRCQTEGEGQTQTIKNETISVNKMPMKSKEMSPKLDDGAGGFPPRDDDGGGGGGGGGGGWGPGGFVFWALILIVAFLRDRELEKPYKIKPKKMKNRSMA